MALYRRSSCDGGPTSTSARGRTRLVRAVFDSATAADGSPGVLVVAMDRILTALFADIEMALMSVEARVEARGPPSVGG